MLSSQFQTHFEKHQNYIMVLKTPYLPMHWQVSSQFQKEIIHFKTNLKHN